ncbi:MAG: cysteine desulfurase NifS [Clostridium sp.]|nr:cysteine desulfurase NifS [Clostridium sp.]MDD7139820.1 cysteine desulfurase NifS [Clostridium sp.]MDY6080607.1 cysteine desulfurase NifS [Eubacteriales bacterium]
MQKVYLDNAATTKVRNEVVEAMLPYFTEYFGNPSSLHLFAREAGKGLDTARAQVAKALNAKPEEIIFTGGGSESDNMVLRGIPEAYKKKGKHVITSAVEHHAVLHTLEAMEKEGRVEVTYLPVDEYGMVTAEQVEKAIRPDTVLVSIMFANNEVGTIMPIEQIGETCRKYGVLFHTDAVQAVGHVPVDVEKMHIDLLSLSGHKFHGPKGVGALYVRKGVRIPALILGGAQERRKRAGTENVPGIVGMGKAIELATAELEDNAAKMKVLRDRLIFGIPARIPDVKLNGHPTERLPNNVNFSIRFIEGESILLMLDLNGIAASSGSACTSGSLDPSHVLLAMGLSHEVAHGSLRLTLSEFTTPEEIDYVLDTLPPIVEKLRAMSPLYHGGNH